MRTALAAALLATLALQPALHAQPKVAADGERRIERNPVSAVDTNETQLKAGAKPAKPLAPKPPGAVREATPVTDKIGVLPAQEVVRLSCPRKFFYRGELEKSSELAGWGVQPLRPDPIRTELRFAEVSNLRRGSWRGATEIECNYYEWTEPRRHSQKLKRKIHPSGTPYRCTLLGDDYSPDVECRLSITPDFP